MVDRQDMKQSVNNRPTNTALKRIVLACGIALFAGIGIASEASAETRSLKLYYIHTKEKKTITFKRNGKYLSKGLKEVNHFLRDWRRNEPTKMDPKLLDLVWEAYKMAGGRDYIHVVSAYRSPATNAMLRKTRGGQAKKSQHTLGKAMDFYIPGVKVSKLRQVGFKLGGGGVGYYPRSGVPFVHLDTGNVRAWPRMSRAELTRLFPKGDTMHVPPDGKALPGYKTALARYKARQSGRSVTVNGGGSSSGGGNLLAKIFGGGRDKEEDDAQATTVASAPARSTRKAAPKPKQTPATLLASLSRRDLPKPIAAPRARPVQNSVPVAITATPEPVVPTPTPPVAVPEPTVQVAAAPPAPLYAPPIPGSRPAVLIARAEPPIDRQSAAELEQAIQASNQNAGQTVEVASAPATPNTDGARAIEQAINAADTAAPATTELAFALPIPQAAPSRPSALPAPEPIARQTQTSLSETVVAYAPPQRSTISDIVAPTPIARPDVPAGKAGRVVETQDELQTAALDPNIVTTPKTARPTSVDERFATTSSAAVVPVEDFDASRFGAWTTRNVSIAENGRADARPDFIKNATRAAPEVVYTAGFSNTPPPNTNSFSGNAVTFLAVAKFDNGTGSGGDGRGEPLQLSVPN